MVKLLSIYCQVLDKAIYQKYQIDFNISTFKYISLMNQSITEIYETVFPLKRFISFSLRNST